MDLYNLAHNLVDSLAVLVFLVGGAIFCFLSGKALKKKSFLNLKKITWIEKIISIALFMSGFVLGVVLLVLSSIFFLLALESWTGTYYSYTSDALTGLHVIIFFAVSIIALGTMFWGYSEKGKIDKMLEQITRN